jgi:hypothetical protein
VAFVDNHERNIGKRISSGNQVVLDDLRGCEDDGCPFPVSGTLWRRGVTGEHDERRTLCIIGRFQVKVPFEIPEVLLHEWFCRGEHQHFALLVVEPGRCHDQCDRCLAKAGRQDHHGVRVQRLHRDGELVLPLLDGIRLYHRVADVLHVTGERFGFGGL